MSTAPSSLPVWWKASQDFIDGSNLNRFRKVLNATYNVKLDTYDDMHAFSVERLEDFWRAVWEWAGVRHSRKFTRVLTDARAVPGDLPRFFDDALVNLAENILFPLHPRNTTACMPNAPKQWPHANTTAVYEWGEALPGDKAPSGPVQFASVSWGEMRRRVAILSTTLRRKGLKPGDRVAHVSANTASPIVTFLACLACGCVFSALPTDAGAQAIYGRLAQVQPRLVLTDDVAHYNGRKVNVIDRVAQVCDQLIENGKAHARELDVVCLINRRDPNVKGNSFDWRGTKAECVSYEAYVASVGLRHDAQGDDAPSLEFEPLPFNHPALIVFSSGTTGEPKSICHSAGGILINGKKESLLMYELNSNDTFLQITTCGWIMWLLQVAQLLSGASIATYDGSPLYPSAFCIPQIIEQSQRITGFGGSPRLLSEMERACKEKKVARLGDQFDLSKLRIATSTGSPLNPTNVRFFYESLAKPNTTQLVSISGGTDLAGCFVGSACNVPVNGHLIGAKCLGMDIRIVDALTGEDCEQSGEPGELVCAKPFPTQPLYFWGEAKDKDALHEKYMDSYYRRFADGPAKGFWAQGDFISRHLPSGALEIHGRSDGVLNPSGVRFGSAEIYSVVEADKFAFVADSIVVGQRRPGKDDDERVLLFVKCREGEKLDEEKKASLAKAIKEAYSARHVPRYIFQVRDIPVTANGKKTELAVKAVVSGNTKFKPSTATANPEALDEYRQYADIEAVVARASKL